MECYGKTMNIKELIIRSNISNPKELLKEINKPRYMVFFLKVPLGITNKMDNRRKVPKDGILSTTSQLAFFRSRKKAQTVIKRTCAFLKGWTEDASNESNYSIILVKDYDN